MVETQCDEEHVTGRHLFRETDEQFTYWYADGYGISPSLVQSAYKGMDIERARMIRDELDEIIEFCEPYQDHFGDL